MTTDKDYRNTPLFIIGMFHVYRQKFIFQRLEDINNFRVEMGATTVTDYAGSCIMTHGFLVDTVRNKCVVHIG